MKSMRAMDGAPELTGMYLQRLFVLPAISPAPGLKSVLLFITTLTVSRFPALCRKVSSGVLRT